MPNEAENLKSKFYNLLHLDSLMKFWLWEISADRDYFFKGSYWGKRWYV